MASQLTMSLIIAFKSGRLFSFNERLSRNLFLENDECLFYFLTIKPFDLFGSATPILDLCLVMFCVL